MPIDLSQMSDAQLTTHSRYLEEMNRLYQVKGGPVPIRICFVLGLLSLLGGIGGAVHGAIGEADAVELRFTCIALLAGAPMAYFAHLGGKRGIAIREEYFASLAELSRRDIRI